MTFKLCMLGHVYRRQQVEEILQSPPASQQSLKQSQAKPSRDTHFCARNTEVICCCSGIDALHIQLWQRDAASTLSAGPHMVNGNIP